MDRVPAAPPPRFVSPHERAHDAQLVRYRELARELSALARTVYGVSRRTTGMLASAGLAPTPRQAGRDWARSAALVRALTNESGLGFAFAGGRLGAAGAFVGDLLGRASLATGLLVASLRLRLSALELVHPEMTEDPRLAHFIEAVHAHHELEILRALRTLFDDEGAVRAFSSLAPMFAEILCLKALLDRNPFNDETAWRMATGQDVPTAEPLFGLSVRLLTTRDRGRGAARPVRTQPYEQRALARRGSLLAFLRTIALLGNDGRIAIQTVRGPDGAERYVVLVPGMRPALRSHGSPASLVGAFRSSLEAVSAYTGALRSALAQYGLPDGAELALIGHSAGGPAVLNLAQDPEFCARYAVTHVIAIGSPVDQKRPADPATFVASITNQHDLVPTADGIDAGSCFALHPEWYVVDYTEATHQFPECHGIEHYLRDLAYLITEAREYLDARLAPFAGEIVRTQLYQTYEHEPKPLGHPFQPVPTSLVPLGSGTVRLPLSCAYGSGLLAFYQVDRDLAAGLAEDGSRTAPLALAGRALVAVFAAEQREGSLRPHRVLAYGVLVDSPWRTGRTAWAQLLRRADQRGVGLRLLGLAASTDQAVEAYRELWGLPAVRARVSLSIGVLAARAVAQADDGTRIGFGGPLGPGAPLPARDVVVYSRKDRTTLRSQLDFSGRMRLHSGALVRLAVGTPGSPPAERLRELGLDRTRPLACLSARGLRARIGAGAPLPGE
jgi:hypothetical protein